MQSIEPILSPKKQGLQRTFRYLGASSAWTIGLFIFSLYMLVTISFLTDAVRLGNYDPLWFVVSGAGFIPPLIIGMLYRFIFLARRPEKTRVGLNLFVAALAGVSRNVSVGYLASITGLDTTVDLPIRVAGGVVMGVALFCVWALSFGSKIDYLSTLRRLSGTQDSLAFARQQMPEQLANTNDTLQEKTRQAVLPQLASIKELLGKSENIGPAVDKLRDTLTNQLRPMMNQIANNQPRPFQLKNMRKLRKVDATLPSRFTLHDKFQVTWSSVLELFGIVFWLVVFDVKNWLFHTVMMFAIYFSILSLFKLMMPKERIFKKNIAIAITVFGSLVASTANVIYISYTIELSDSAIIMLTGFALISGIAGPVLFLGTKARIVKRLEIENQIRDDLLTIAKENSLFAQKLWVFRKRWLLVLHGSVQSALTAALTRLQNSKTADPVTLELVKQDLFRAESAVSTSLRDEIDLDAGFKELQAVWAGICSVSITITPRARRALNRSFESCFCVNEIIKEAVSNAVRHGEATTASVLIERMDDDLLRIEVTNNGSVPKTKDNKGIGSEMLDEICLTWGIDEQDSAVRLVAELPVKL